MARGRLTVGPDSHSLGTGQHDGPVNSASNNYVYFGSASGIPSAPSLIETMGVNVLAFLERHLRGAFPKFG